MGNAEVQDLKGKTLVRIRRSDEELEFLCDDGNKYVMLHMQDCCEHVYIEDIVGELADLIGEPLLIAREVSSEDTPPPYYIHEPESYTWTFYQFATSKGYVTIRWFGCSNGWYSERVDFQHIGRMPAQVVLHAQSENAKQETEEFGILIPRGLLD